jgi:two-component system sensor histidine kinase BaeS
VSARPRRFRNRLLIAMVGIAVGVLVFTGAATVLLTRRTTVEVAESELRERAPRVEASLTRLRTRFEGQQQRQRDTPGEQRVTRDFGLLLRDTLQVAEGSLVLLTPGGAVEPPVSTTAPLEPGVPGGPLQALPPGVSAGDLDIAALARGEQQTGRREDVVFLAIPFEPEADGDVPVVVLTNRIEWGLAGRAGPFFLVAAVVAVGAAFGVSYVLARRFTRPLASMGTAASRIAAGDLSARVDLGDPPSDELDELARTLNRMAEQLDSARGQERAFLLSVSHDLRTPLTSIRGYAEAIADGTAADGATRRRAAVVIASESRRLERLVADLLDLARLDSRQFSLRTQPFDAVTVVRDALDAFRPAAADLGVELRYEAPPTAGVDTDPERLGQIVANLVENALKYARSRIDVEVLATEVLELRVHDDGPGVDPDEVGHVFERLYTARDTPGRTVGTGLGLAIVRELAVAMGGHAAASAAGGSGGATFTVRLPVRRARATAR